MRYVHFMKRTTVMLPDETLARLRRESRLRGSSVAEIVRGAVEEHLAQPTAPTERRLAFFAIGESGARDASKRVDEYVGDAITRRLTDARS